MRKKPDLFFKVRGGSKIKSNFTDTGQNYKSQFASGGFRAETRFTQVCKGRRDADTSSYARLISHIAAF